MCCARISNGTNSQNYSVPWPLYSKCTRALTLKIFFIFFCGRTRETAQVLLDSLGRKGEQPEVCTWLRERFFGSFELMDHKHYEDVWALDKNNDEHSEFGVEPAAAVRRRVLGKYNNSQRSMS